MGLMQKLQRTYYRTLTRHIPSLRCKPEELRSQGYSSQYGQDKFVVERLGRLRGGVFFEIGAFDGITLSNTHYLETQLGWTGIAVEPSRVAFEKLRDTRTCITVNGCIAAEPGRTQFLEIQGYAAMLSGVLHQYHPLHRKRVDRELNEVGGSLHQVEVTCYTVAQLAREHDIEHIDYLSVDTEGGELSILQSIDFSRLDIRLVTVENNYKDMALRTFMRKSGFEFVATIDCDEVYENRRYL
jgi:FkbM family methyltransferase